MPRESKKARRERTERMIAILRETYPDAKCALDHQGPLQLLIATILSAQCTDQRVNMVTPALFDKYRSAEDFATADGQQLEEMIRSTGFYRNKAKNIRAACQRIVDEHGGEVPQTMDELLALPGVARKTANVVLGNAFGINEGVTVDTHVRRLSQRLKLTREKDPQKIEKDLMQMVPQDKWAEFSHLLIFHGRQICTARAPACEDCPINHLCPSAGKVK